MSCAVVLALCSVLVAGCGADDERPAVRTGPPLQRADQADEGLGVRLTYRTTATLDGHTTSARGYKQAEGDRRRVRRVEVAPGVRDESFIDGPNGIVPTDAGTLFGPETRWLKADRDAVATASGTTPTQSLEELLPSEVLELVLALGPRVRTAGSERIAGIVTRRYRLAMALAALDRQAFKRDGTKLGCLTTSTKGSVRLVLWIDGGDLIRRQRLRCGTRLVSTTTITGYDRDLHVDLPHGSDVQDITDALVTGARNDGGATDGG